MTSHMKANDDVPSPGPFRVAGNGREQVRRYILYRRWWACTTLKTQTRAT
jgi:hypothetical protein